MGRDALGPKLGAHITRLRLGREGVASSVTAEFTDLSRDSTDAWPEPPPAKKGGGPRPILRIAMPEAVHRSWMTVVTSAASYIPRVGTLYKSVRAVTLFVGDG